MNRRKGRRTVWKLFVSVDSPQGYHICGRGGVPQGSPIYLSNEHETTNPGHLRKASGTRDAGTKCRSSFTQSSVGERQDMRDRLGGYMVSSPNGPRRELVDPECSSSMRAPELAPDAHHDPDDDREEVSSIVRNFKLPRPFADFNSTRIR